MKKILAIDDKPDNLTTIKAVIKSQMLNCIVLTASSGIEGIELAKKEQPDTILLDIIMPQMDGYETCKRLKEDNLTKHIPVIMVTAIKTDMQSRVKALDLGADAFLSKPIDAIELKAQVNVMLRIKEAEDKLREEKHELETIVLKRTKELQLSKQKYKTLYDFAPIPYQSLSEDGSIDDINPSWLSLLGYERDEVIGKMYADFIHPEDIAVLQQNFPILLNQGHVHQVPFRIRHKDGHYFDIALEGCSASNPEDNSRKTYCVFQDITKRKKAERNLRDSEERYKNFISQVSEGVYRFELDQPMSIDLPVEEQIDFLYEHMIIAECNQAFMQMYGYKSLNEVIGKSQLELHGGNDIPENRKALRDFIISGYRSENIETTEPGLNGELRYFSNNSVGIIENGYLVRTWGTQTDITERKAAEKELIKLSKAVEQSPVSIVITNTEGAIEYANPKAAEITGYQLEELIGENPRIFKSGEQSFSVYENLWSTISSGNKWVGEFHNKKKNGELFWEHASISPIIDESNDITHYIAVKEDITERKIAEKALKESLLNFKLIFENSPIGIYMATKNGDIIDANLALLDILGSPSIEATKSINVLKFPPLVQNSYADKFKQCVKEGITIEFEMDYTSKWGKESTLHSFLVPLKDTEENVSNVYTLIEDITERKRSEKIQTIIFKISNAVNATENLEQLISFIRKELGKIIDTSNFYLALYDTKTDSLSLPFFSDEHDNFTSLPAEKTITRYVIQTKESLLANLDTIHKLENSGVIGSFGAESLIWLGVPLKVEGEVIGVLAVQSYTDEKAYNESDKKMLEFISDQISILIHRKNTNDLLKKSEERYRSLVVNLPIGIFQSTFEGRIVSANPAMAEMYGYDSVDELLQVPADKYYGKNNPRDEMLTALKKKGYLLGYETLENKKDGSFIWVSANYRASFDAKGNSIEGAIIDITERKNAHELLKKSEERFNLAMKASNDGLYDWNLVTNEVYYSARWKSILGYNDDELPNDISIWESLSHQEEKEAYLLTLQNAIEKKIEHYNVEFRMKHKLGHWVNIIARAQLIYNEEGKAVRVVGTHSDLTEEKIADQKLRNALIKAQESDRLKSAFLANMSHEIRTPMNGIMGFAQLLKEPSLEGADQMRFIDIIVNSGNRMLNIINDLIDISKIEAGQTDIIISEVNLNEQTEYLYTFFKPEAEKKGLQLRFKNTLSNSLATIQSDREKIFAILTNIIKNAIKYTKKGSIEFGYNLRINKDTEELEFYVKDTGIGIAQNKLEAIFERFVQADLSLASEYEGAGLGLAITKGYIELLGGRIWVESKVGQGSIFYFTIPYRVKSNQKHKKKGLESKPVSDLNKGKFNILIVEDDEISEFYLRTLSKDICNELLHAKTGIEAVEICKKETAIDLIFMDIKMPEMDGYTATRKIREFNKDVKIIAQSAYALEGERAKALDAGCNDYISKPTPKDKLMELVWKHMIK